MVPFSVAHDPDFKVTFFDIKYLRKETVPNLFEWYRFQ